MQVIQCKKVYDILHALPAGFMHYYWPAYT